MRSWGESLFGLEGGLNNGDSGFVALTLAGDKLGEEVVNLARRGVAGWIKTRFINERESMMDEFELESFDFSMGLE